MARPGLGRRPYGPADLQELLGEVVTWAQSWDHVLDHVHERTRGSTGAARRMFAVMADDVERLKIRGVAYNTDSRRIWREITGQRLERLGPPQPAGGSAATEREYLEELRFPVTKADLIQAARTHGAPQRVLEVFGRLEDRSYRTLASLLEEIAAVAAQKAGS